MTSSSADREAAVRDAVRGFILSSINVEHLRDDELLFESGLVNSLFAVQMMTFIEKAFAIEMVMDDLDIENFKSLDAVAAFVVRKSGAQVA